MVNFSISHEIFKKLPELKIGVVFALGVDQEKLPKDILRKIHKEQARLKKELEGYSDYKEFPTVKAWHKAFRRLGINPKKYPPAIENLIRITAKGIKLSSINPIVDIENYIALKYLVPVGGQDLDKVKGEIVLEVLKTPLPFRALGKEKVKTINAHIPVYRDAEKILCIGLNSKDCEEAKFTKESKNIVIFVESIGEKTELNEILADLAATLSVSVEGIEKRVYGYF